MLVMLNLYPINSQKGTYGVECKHKKSAFKSRLSLIHLKTIFNS